MQPHRDVSYTRKLPALEALQARPQWVCWRKEQRQGKLTKVPYSATTGRRAESDNPATWASYAQVVQAQRTRQYDGIGYMFHRDYTGVDLDHCINPDGSIDPWAQAYLNQLKSYAEYSPSKTGIHILVRGTIPSGIRRRMPDAPHSEAAIEMYCERRYFTITGNHVDGTPTTIEACPALASLYATLTAPKPQPAARQPGAAPAGDVPASDDALLEKAMHAKNGATFRALWHGDTSGYASQSEAELAFCHLLAFWTGNDPHRMDRLYRRSTLYRREKWDRPARTGETYGEGTIARAIANCREVYHPQSKGKIIPFRREWTAAGNERAIPVPETEVDFILECLHDGEEGDARLYAHLFRGQCVYDHTEKLWYEWEQHYWKPDETKHALLMASNHLASEYMEASAALSEEAAQAEKHLGPDLLKSSKTDDPHVRRYEWLKATTGALIDRAKGLKTLRRAQAVLTYAQAYLSITSREWDTNPWLLGTREGVLDLKTGELRDGKPEEYIRTIIPTTWRGLHEPAPRFEQYLREIFADRAEGERDELINFLQRTLGYGITGNVNEHIFLMLYGEEGRNGKDTLMTRLQRVLGSTVGAVSNDVIIASGKYTTPGSAKPHLCALQGKRIAWASETSKGARFDVGQVKFLTGGGDIPARQLYGRDYTFAPSHLLILLTNHKPHADAQDAAFWDRLCPIIFSMRFVDHPAAPNERQKDRTLNDALEGGASGILAWLVRGCLAWQHEGLNIPVSVLMARREYREEEDTLRQFLNACCTLHEHASVKANRLYERYKEWATENNLKAMNGNAFGLEMKRLFAQKRRNEGNVYHGIGLLEDGVPTPLFQDEGLHSPKTPSEAASPPFIDVLSVGSVPISQKVPSIKGDKTQKESYQELPTPSTLSTSISVGEAASEEARGQCSPSAGGEKETTREREWEEFIL
jgi:putative DNA primase/helicase